MSQAKTEVALQFLECCAAEVALQPSLFCSADVILTKSCAAASEKLHCNIAKAALQESGAFLPLSCGFQAPTFRHPRLGPAHMLSLLSIALCFSCVAGYRAIPAHPTKGHLSWGIARSCRSMLRVSQLKLPSRSYRARGGIAAMLSQTAFYD